MMAVFRKKEGLRGEGKTNPRPERSKYIFPGASTACDSFRSSSIPQYRTCHFICISLRTEAREHSHPITRNNLIDRDQVHVLERLDFCGERCHDSLDNISGCCFWD